MIPTRRYLLTLLAGLVAVPALGQGEPLSLDRFSLLVAAQSRPSFAILGAGARPGGMGGAFTALADDASAASFNPAGLALLVTPEASLVFDGRSQRDEHQAFSTMGPEGFERYTASDNTFDTLGVNFASATFPLTVADRNLSLQISYHRLIDLDFRSDRAFDELGAGGMPVARYRQQVNQNGAIYTLGLTAAYQLTQRLSVGVTAARWQGSWAFSSEVSERELASGEAGDRELASGEAASLRFEQQNEWSGWNLSAGFLLRYRYLNVGASTRLPFDGTYRVDTRLTTSFENPFTPTSTLDGRLGWPGSWTVGLAAKPFETWIVTADYAEYDWDDMLIRGLPGEPLSFFDLRPESESTTENQAQWRFGTEVTLLPGRNVIGLRAGYAIEPRAERLADEDDAPESTSWTAGLGWSRGGFSVDVAVQRVRTSALRPEFVDPDQVAEGQVVLPANARVVSEEHRVLLSALYRFPSRAALAKLFHFVFVGPNEAKQAKPAP